MHEIYFGFRYTLYVHVVHSWWFCFRFMNNFNGFLNMSFSTQNCCGSGLQIMLGRSEGGCSSGDMQNWGRHLERGSFFIWCQRVAPVMVTLQGEKKEPNSKAYLVRVKGKAEQSESKGQLETRSWGWGGNTRENSNKSLPFKVCILAAVAAEACFKTNLQLQMHQKQRQVPHKVLLFTLMAKGSFSLQLLCKEI